MLGNRTEKIACGSTASTAPSRPVSLHTKCGAPFSHAAGREGKATLALSSKPCFAFLKQSDHRRMEKKPRITALHPAGDPRIALFITDVVGPGGQADRDGVRAVPESVGPDRPAGRWVARRCPRSSGWARVATIAGGFHREGQCPKLSRSIDRRVVREGLAIRVRHFRANPFAQLPVQQRHMVLARMDFDDRVAAELRQRPSSVAWSLLRDKTCLRLP